MTETTLNDAGKSAERKPIVNPKWAKPTMTLAQAGEQAAARDCVLQVSWSGMMGLRVMAIPRAPAE